MPEPVGELRLERPAVNLLGPFSITWGRTAPGRGPARAPGASARLVLVSAGRRISREAACEVLFPNLAPPAAANALSRALSMAKTAPFRPR